ncbi:hypothetical protein H6P81_019027 [Aristolochia fimbriata]|uniref:Uncharacterized protein n=1 Tax=Aristolochia fimbriata TaxID=158543 RepID=A0AAV7E3L8_ARIFI|nr:hypothetical protein H6P81_019027 [Aristolochia fimbriata]
MTEQRWMMNDEEIKRALSTVEYVLGCRQRALSGKTAIQDKASSNSDFKISSQFNAEFYFLTWIYKLQ